MSTRKQWLVGSVVGVLSVAVIVVPVYALSKCAMCAKDATEMVAKMDSAQITLTKAIEAAEKRANGKALTAFTERDADGNVVFAVYVFRDGKVYSVDVKQDGSAGRAQDAEDVPGLHDEATHKVEKKRSPGG